MSERDMNQFMAKKLGEAWAFCRLGKDIISRGDESFIEAYGEESTDWLAQILDNYGQAAKQAGNDHTTVKEKADATVKKLSEMMERYIGDEWNNPVELLEWMSFYSGAAAAHWSVVSGAAEATDNEELKTIAIEASQSFTELGTKTQEKLRILAAKRARD